MYGAHLRPTSSHQVPRRQDISHLPTYIFLVLLITNVSLSRADKIREIRSRRSEKLAQCFAHDAKASLAGDSQIQQANRCTPPPPPPPRSPLPKPGRRIDWLATAATHPLPPSPPPTPPPPYISVATSASSRLFLKLPTELLLLISNNLDYPDLECFRHSAPAFLARIPIPVFHCAVCLKKRPWYLFAINHHRRPSTSRFCIPCGSLPSPGNNYHRKQSGLLFQMGERFVAYFALPFPPGSVWNPCNNSTMWVEREYILCTWCKEVKVPRWPAGVSYHCVECYDPD